MIKQNIRKVIRPIRRRMQLEISLNSIIISLLIGNGGLLLLSLISHVVVFPYATDWMGRLFVVALLMGFFIGLLRFPKTQRVIHQTDLLGAKERLQTSWEFADNQSIEAGLQREETRVYLQTSKLKSNYVMHLKYKELLIASCLLLVAIGLLFVPSKTKELADKQEVFAEKVLEKEKEFITKKDELLEKYPLSEKQKEELEATLKPLLEKLQKAKSEEEALKQLSIAKDEIKKLELDQQSKLLQKLGNVAQKMAQLKDTETSDNKTTHREELNKLLEQMEKALSELDDQENKAVKEALTKKLEELAAQIDEANTDGQNESEQTKANDQAALTAEELAKLLEELAAKDNGSNLAEDLLQSINEMAKAVSTESSISDMAFSSQSSQSSNSSSSGSDVPVSEAGEVESEGAESGTGTGESEGSGTGEGTGEGEGSGTGEGTGEGEGSGTGEGAGNGDGQGAGTGTGTGTGQGAGTGTGQGSGRGTGSVDSTLFSPTRLGGSSEPNYVSGTRTESGDTVTQDANDKPLDTGGLVPYEELYREYYEQAQKNMTTLDVPIVMKDIILEYFSKIE